MAAEQGSPMDKVNRNTPIVVTARTLLADNRKKTVTYTENVVVKKDDITLYANQVVIHLKDSGKGRGQAKTASAGSEVFQGSGKIDNIEATGSVKVVQQDKTATSDKAIYYSDSDKIVMTGHPRVWQGENVLNGNRITYDIKADTFLVEEAKTVLYQGGEAPAGAAAPEAGKTR